METAYCADIRWCLVELNGFVSFLICLIEIEWSGTIPQNRIFALDSEPTRSKILPESDRSCFFCRFRHQQLSRALPCSCPAHRATMERRSSCSRKGARHPPCSHRRASPWLVPCLRRALFVMQPWRGGRDTSMSSLSLVNSGCRSFDLWSGSVFFFESAALLRR
jgi:hypothetical protein